MEQLDQLCDKLNLDQFESINSLKKIAEKLNVKVSYLILGLIVIILCLIIADIEASLISGLIGFFYPLYISLKAQQEDNNNQNKNLTRYYLIYSFILLFDSILEQLLYFIPMYHLLKVIFFIWLINPKTNGADLIFEKVLQPMFKKYQSQIWENIDQINQKSQQIVDEFRPIMDQTEQMVKKNE